MKKLSLSVLTFFIMGSMFAQEKMRNFVSDCPPGSSPVYVMSCDGFNFHRPIKECRTGFWFCSYGCTGWHIECRGNEAAYFGASQNNTVIVWGERIKNKFALHFPIELTTAKGFTEEDLKVFSVDEEDTFYKNGTVSYTMLKGQYPVTRTERELIVWVDIK